MSGVDTKKRIQMKESKLKEIEEMAFDQNTIELIGEVRRLKKIVLQLKQTNKQLENDFELASAVRFCNEWEH